MSPLEAIAVVVSVLGIWLTARRHMACWPVGLVACALYFKLFYDVRLYADMVLQLLFGLSTLYGWVAWRRGTDDAGEVMVRPLPRGEAALGLAAGALGGLVIGWFTSHFTDAALPWMDSTLSSFSLVAQVWTARRQSANWLLWIAVDVVYVGMFVFKSLFLTAGLYAVLTMLAVIGYRRWVAASRA